MNRWMERLLWFAGGCIFVMLLYALV